MSVTGECAEIAGNPIEYFVCGLTVSAVNVVLPDVLVRISSVAAFCAPE
jgi:hypothetical protein